MDKDLGLPGAHVPVLSSQFLRPLPRRVKHPQDFHRFTSRPVRHDVRSSRNHQLSRPRNSSCPAQGRIPFQKILSRVPRTPLLRVGL